MKEQNTLKKRNLRKRRSKFTALEVSVHAIPNTNMYSRVSEIETADLSQSHASFNLSQFRAYCLFHRNSNTATKTN